MEKRTDQALADMYGISLRTVSNYKAAQNKRRLIYDALVDNYESNLIKNTPYRLSFMEESVVMYSEYPHKVDNISYFKIEIFLSAVSRHTREVEKGDFRFHTLSSGVSILRKYEHILELIKDELIKWKDAGDIKIEGVRKPKVVFSDALVGRTINFKGN